MASGAPGGSRRRIWAPPLRRAPEREPVPAFGETLRQARVARRITLEDAERDTRIPLKYLAALEEQEYGALPSPVYARGVLRAYCEYLGLEPTALLDAFRPPRAREERSAIRPAGPLAPQGLPFSWSMLVGLLLLAGGIVLTVYLYGQYVALSESLVVPERPPSRGDLDIPEPLVSPWTPLPRPTPVAVALGTPAEGEDPAAAGGPTPAASPEPTGVAAPATSPAPAATPPPSPTATPVPPPRAAVTVEARIVERSWVQVWADGRQVFAETLAPGAARTFTANDSLQMRVSNAGGVQVVVNGEGQGRLGTSGQAVDVTWGRR
jgi:cytoskeleton protein RodZ